MFWKSDHHEKNRVTSFKGNLLKLKRRQNIIASKWNKRWFSLEGRFLNYYRCEQDISFSGTIDLRYIKSIKRSESDERIFVIVTQDRDMCLKAGSVKELKSWIRALHINVNKARGGEGDQIVSNSNMVLEPNQGLGKVNSCNKPQQAGSANLEALLDINLIKLHKLEKLLDNTTSEFDRADSTSTSTSTAFEDRFPSNAGTVSVETQNIVEDIITAEMDIDTSLFSSNSDTVTEHTLTVCGSTLSSPLHAQAGLEECEDFAEDAADTVYASPVSISRSSCLPSRNPERQTRMRGDQDQFWVPTCRQEAWIASHSHTNTNPDNSVTSIASSLNKSSSDAVLPKQSEGHSACYPLPTQRSPYTNSSSAVKQLRVKG